MEDITLREYKILADVLDKVPLQGTIHTLPKALQDVTLIRFKIQKRIEEMENERKTTPPVDHNKE